MDKNTDREARRDAARERAELAVDARVRERELAVERANERKKERLLTRRAREREEDIRAGRPQRGLFTGRGRRDDTDDQDDDRDDDHRGDRGNGRTGFFSSSRFRDDDEADRPRTGAKRSVMKAITQLPSYLRLLIGLISDSRVSKMDRFFVIAAAAYIVSPIDFIPDVIPFLGQVDDVFLLMIALQRLVNNAGRPVLLKHWRGNPNEVRNLNFARILTAAGFFLPSRMKRRLFKLAGGTSKRRG